MFTQTWNKYLPVIKILINRSSSTGKETLGMNRTDFERAAGGKKVKFTFTFALENGRAPSKPVLSPLARELVTALNENEVTKPLVRSMHLEFSLNNDFLLTIRNSTPQENGQHEENAGDSNGEGEQN